MIGYSDEKKGYRLLTNGKFIVSRDVFFYENESKSAEEIEELKVIKEKEKCKVNQIHIIGMNLFFLHLKMIHLVHLIQQHHLGPGFEIVG
jgi:hypothetical protein